MELYDESFYLMSDLHDAWCVEPTSEVFGDCSQHFEACAYVDDAAMEACQAWMQFCDVGLQQHDAALHGYSTDDYYMNEHNAGVEDAWLACTSQDNEQPTDQAYPSDFLSYSPSWELQAPQAEATSAKPR